MNYKKSELTIFAKLCACGVTQMLNAICAGGDITGSEIGIKLRRNFGDDEGDEKLLLEVSKRFAKYTRDESSFDVENADVQDFQHIISLIVNCCEENNWFR